jgi:hypothetical protein
MKKIKTIVLVGTIFTSSLALCARELPPIPSIGYKEQKAKAIRECKVPPQIAILPPQIDKDYRTCVNNYYVPDPRNVEALVKKVAGKNSKYISTKPAEGFVRAYEITYEVEEEGGFFSKTTKKTTKILLCDDSLNNCYKVQDLATQK